MNNHNRTTSILQRIPAILAVTAASYGLTLQHVPNPGASARTQSGTTVSSGLQPGR